MHEARGPDHEHAADRWLEVAQVQSRRPGRRHDQIRRNGRTHTLKARNVVRAVPHRVIGHVHDVVAGGRSGCQDSGDAGHGFGAAIHDTIEVDEKQHAQDATGEAREAYGGADPCRGPGPA